MTSNDSSSENSKLLQLNGRKKLPESSTTSIDIVKSKEKVKKKKEKNKKQKDKKENKKERQKKEKLRKTKSDQTAIRIASKTSTGTTSGTQHSSAESDATTPKKKCCWKRKQPKPKGPRGIKDIKEGSETGEREAGERRSSNAVVIQDAKAGVSLMFDPRYTCNPFYTPPAVTKDFKKIRSVPPVVQPVIGVCTQGRCGGVNGSITGKIDSAVHEHPVTGSERLVEVRYALVRISVFPNYTTYEIMQSSKKKPKKVPDVVEGIFVTKRGDDVRQLTPYAIGYFIVKRVSVISLRNKK